MAPKKIGRRKGTRNKGFFFRSGRGWYTKRDGQFIPLLDENGARLRDKDTPERLLREASARVVLNVPAQPVIEQQASSDWKLDAPVGEVCAAYLAFLRTGAGDIGRQPTGPAKTYVDRGQTLFDFCYGLPGEFFCNGDTKKREAKGSPEGKRLHEGFGMLLCSELRPGHVDEWLRLRKWKKGGWRTRVQALKRAFNFGVERKMIDANPIRGYKLPRSATRITYLTPEQEAAMREAAGWAFATALKVCIRTGARFGCEFAALRRKHVRDHGDRMEWVFKAEESKTKRLRIVRVTDPEIIALVRQGLKTGDPVFKNSHGRAWTRKMLSHSFRRVKQKVRKKGILLDEDACMYSCRHTYAKRTLEGFWSGKPVSINTLARLMGNSVQICIAHYLQFSEADNEMLWTSA